MRVSSAILLAIQQLSAPEFWRVLVRAIGLSVITFIGLAVGFNGHWSIGAWRRCRGSAHCQFLGGFSTLGLAWVLFPVVATFMVGLFVEDISEAIELAYHGEDPPGQSPVFISGLLSSA